MQANYLGSIENCTFIKTILMLLVVVGHSCIFWTGSWLTTEVVEIESPVLGLLAEWLGSFHIYCFTLVSGYIFYSMKYERGKYDRLYPFVCKKVRRLIIPYVFVAIVWVIPISALIWRYNYVDIIKYYVLCSNPSQLWFLWMLFWAFIISWFLSTLFKEKGIIGLAIAVIFYILGTLANGTIPDVFCFLTGLRYVIFFFIGFKIRQSNGRFEKRIHWIVWLSTALIAFVVSRLFCSSGDLMLVLDFVTHVTGAIAAFEILQKIANRFKWKDDSLFCFLSEKSMPIYLFRQQIIYFAIILLNGKIHPYVNALVCFGCAMIGSVIISSILMRFETTKKLIGEK